MEKLPIEEIKKLAEKVAVEKLAPHASEIDQNPTFPWENICALRQAGFHRLITAKEDDGMGCGRVAFALAVKEVAKSCASTALVYVSHSIAAKAIELGGSETIKKKFLPEIMKGWGLGAFAVHESDSGSNSGAITTTARREDSGYVVNGSKFFITSAGEADFYLVLVRTDPEKGPQGMSTLLIEKGTPGLSFGCPEDTMGLRSTSSRKMFFSDCWIPGDNLIGKEGEGTPIIGKTVIGWGFFGAAAISTGIAIAATELAIKHAKERTIGGQPIGAHQAVQFMVTDMVLGAEAADSLVMTYADKADSKPETAVINGLKAKLFASDTAINVTNLAIQAMGGHGYCRDYIVERLFRDARGLTLHFKTSEWLRQDIAKAVIGI